MRMSLTNAQSPFKIPELCSLIASHLTLYDFTQLCLVSKSFSRLFQPFLWSKIVLHGRADYRDRMLPRVNALKRYGHLVRRAELFSWCNRDVFSECEDDEDPEAILENDDLLLTETLLAQCGCNLTALKVVDYSSNGRIWGAVMERIRLNRALEGARLLNGIRVLDITLTHIAFKSVFQPLLAQPKRYSGAAALFTGVKELRLCGTEVIMDSAEELAWEEEVCYGSELDDVDEPPVISFQDLVTLFPSLHKLTLAHLNIDIDIDLDADGSEKGADARPSESGVATIDPPEDYQFHTLNFQESSIHAKQIGQILKRTHNVQSLKIGPSIFPMEDVEALLLSLPELTPCLTEYGQDGVHFSDWSTVLQGLPCLTRLYISTDTLVADDALGTLARSCPGLENLHLHYCQSLTYRGLHHILRSCKQLKSLKLPMTPVHWDIFGHDSEHCSCTAVPSSITTVPSPPSAFVPWACQDTLQDLLLTLMEDNPPECLFAARQRLQSLSHLHGLELRGQKISVAMLMDLEHSEGPPLTLYPALETLELGDFDPPLAIGTITKLARSMPKLKQASHRNHLDSTLHAWRLQELPTLI
ncbi:hypothetical protein KVV02_006963 [Mortierella alpina]|uniref:F-box domain-containing protein n=1 Tax=Mortierella alpina TaxID=64518 RepID=A0A9P8A6N7_MORAP|nr:hypothetical protein KVV02_006963 [Mortierella alpina]